MQVTPLSDELRLDEVAKSIKIPPCPALLVRLQKEMNEDSPDPRKIADIIGRDVAMSATLLKLANSAFFNSTRRRADSIDQAIALIGTRQCGAMLMGLIARNAISNDGPAMQRFWDVSEKRAFSMAILSKKVRIVKPDAAHTFGLFCDIGIPLLMGQFPDYLETLALANSAAEKLFTAVEEERHQTSHALIGATLVRTWGLPTDIALSVRHHHDYAMIADSVIPDNIRGLIALSLVVERAIQTYENKNQHVEWEKGGALALEFLAISDEQLTEICKDLHDRYALV